MTTKIGLNEGSEDFKNIKDEWKARASGMTIDELPTFLKDLTEKYSHDYGTICHAMATAAVAAIRAINNSECGGITGFQVGAVMWEFVRNWNYSSNKTGLKMVDYDNFLHPQYDYRYDKTLSKNIWENLQRVAQEKITEADQKFQQYLVDLEQYKTDIAAFVTKYPDYYDNREHYDPLSMGNCEQWEAEEKKKASGFEFAPQEPFKPVNGESRVYKHWQSIIDGVVPFGHTITEY